MSSPTVDDSISAMKVSVIVPIYSADRFLDQCLSSIVKQSLKEIEVICVNDASPGDCENIVAKFARSDPRIIPVTHDSNLGLAAARNSGLNRASGKYVIFVDSDDFLTTSNALSLLYNTAEEDNSDETIGGIIKWDENTGAEYLDWHSNYLNESVRGLRLVDIPSLRANVIAVNKLIRKQLLVDNEILFNPAIRKHEDNPFSLRVHAVAARISIVPSTTYTYRQSHGESITSTMKKSDAHFCVLYCRDVFQFVENSSDAEILRAMYYPMYVTQLVLAAFLFEQYPVNRYQRSTFIRAWGEVLAMANPEAPYMGQRQRRIMLLANKKKYGSAWNMALAFGQTRAERHPESSFKTSDWGATLERERLSLESRQRELGGIQHLVREIYQSRSWRLTAPYRKLAGLVRSRS